MGGVLDQTTKMYRHMVVEAAFLHTQPNCYFVGPYAQRVAFASQQIRAVDLAGGLQAIKRRIFARKDAAVAVVGAGLAGMMAAAAMRATGVKIHIFEAGDAVLGRHRRARHRLVHPTVSRWPFESIDHTSSLPLFNWCADSCDRVMEKVGEEFHNFLNPKVYQDGPISSEDFVIAYKSRVMGMRLAAPDDGVRRTKLILESCREPLTDKKRWVAHEYDLVIVATGYGVENGDAHPTAKSYWDEDGIEAEINRENQEEGSEDRKTYYVSGCGDGGLMDFFRIIHGNFKMGWLAVAVAKALEGTGIAEELETAEVEALMWARSVLRMEQEKGKKSGTDTDEEVLDKLWPVYEKIASRLRAGGFPEDSDTDREIYRKVDAVLCASLDAADMEGRAFLVSKLSRPFKAFAAPIHKLLIAHALARSPDFYRRGTYNYAGDGVETIDIPGKPLITSKNSKIKIIPRHGSEPGDASLLSDEEARSLQMRQLMLADWIRSGNRDGEFSYFSGYPAWNKSPAEHVRFQLEHIRNFVKAMDDRYDLKADQTGKLSRICVSNREWPDKESVRWLGFAEGISLELPKKLFGLLEVADGEVEAFPALEDE